MILHSYVKLREGPEFSVRGQSSKVYMLSHESGHGFPCHFGSVSLSHLCSDSPWWLNRQLLQTHRSLRSPIVAEAWPVQVDVRRSRPGELPNLFGGLPMDPIPRDRLFHAFPKSKHLKTMRCRVAMCLIHTPIMLRPRPAGSQKFATQPSGFLVIHAPSQRSTSC